MCPRQDLTDEQRAVVRHGDGPAVVRAVPGAGKTTAMIHRIHHLVATRGVPPTRILASSFSRATVQDVEDGLADLGVHGADVRTLHSLGHALLRRSDETRLPRTDDEAPSPEAAAHRLAREALRTLAAERNVEVDALGLTPRELVDRVAAWKQQLVYADPDRADVPPSPRERARTATHEDENLVALYRHFEAHRRQRGWLTYPDLLRDGWAVLTRDETLRSRVQSMYHHVVVDEFQDVSRVQFHLLDVLTARHRNYVVIGDVDQCIYGWRGANPDFLLDFADRYDATEYLLTASFRLPAAPLVLANAVITENENRPDKQLHLRQGFDGDAHLLAGDGSTATASRIAETIDDRRNDGYDLNEIALLVRTYGQTPPLERALTDRDLPYRLRGHAPFYRRRETQTLLRYLYWAVLERRLRASGWFEDPNTAERYLNRFAHVLKTPTRYVQHGRVDRIRQEARSQRTSVLDVLSAHQSGMPASTADRVAHFLDVAERLVERLDAPPSETLDWLIEAIDYETALRDRSAFRSRGDARVRSARAMVRYAAAYDSAPALLRGIRSLAAEQAALSDTTPAVDLRSIHRAKGAEWPIVIVPGCVEGTLPLTPDEGERDLEEERRLFYVAVTRPREHLYLAYDNSEERSRFLDEAAVDTRLETVRRLQSVLQADPARHSDKDLAQLCHDLAAVGLANAVERWWRPSPNERAALRRRLDALRPAIERAKKRRSAARQARAEHEANERQARAEARRRVDDLRSIVGTAPLSATNEQPDVYFPEAARLTFGWADDATRVAVRWDGTRVGTIDPLGPHRLDADALLDLPWDAMVGRFATVARGRDALRFTIDWDETEARLANQTIDALSPPEPPSETTRLLTSAPFQRGYERLRTSLSESEEGP